MKLLQSHCKPLLALITIILTFFLLCDCSNPQTKSSGLLSEQKQALLGGFEVYRYSLENGLRLLIVEDPSSPTFAYQTWFHVGSKNEKENYTGLAHLFEHLMFKETKNLKQGEFDKLLEEAGAQGENAFTSKDYTAYIQELPEEQLELIARLEAERMVNLEINPRAFETERDVVQNERRFRNENNPDGAMNQELFSLSFLKHPYRWPVIGYEEDLKRMTHLEALKFYKEHYSPNHATIIVTGHVQQEKVLKIIKKYYESIPSQPIHGINTAEHETEPKQTAARFRQLKLNTEVEKLFIGYVVPGIAHSDYPALTVLQTLLASGKSSRLHQALVEKGITTDIAAGLSDGEDYSLFAIETNLQKNRKTSEAEKIILYQLKKLLKDLVSEQELQKAKNKLLFEFYAGLQTNYEKAYFLGHYETIAGCFEKGIKLYENIKTLQPQSIQGIIKKYFSEKSRNVIQGVRKK